MKHTTTAALMLSLGVANIYAQQRPVRMTFSGSKVATAINLGPNTRTDEVHLAGSGAPGPFTFRGLRTDETTPPLIGSCGKGFGPNIRVVAGGGVFRFQDGSLLTVKLKEGTLCVDVSDMNHPVGHLTDAYEITGGTERFEGAKGSLALKATMGLVLSDASNLAVLLTIAGDLEGTIVGVGRGQEREDGRSF
jgi:hypothetical protein